jgi:hypothetical protein
LSGGKRAWKSRHFFRVKKEHEMRKLAQLLAAPLAVLALSSALMAQQETARPRRPVQPGYVAEGVPKMPNPPGPVPKQDFTGAWVGPQNVSRDPMSPMSPAVEARFKQNKPTWQVMFARAMSKSSPPTTPSLPVIRSVSPATF